MNTPGQELLEIIQDLDELKRKQAQAQGALKEVQKEFKTKFDCRSLAEVKKRIRSLEKEIKGEQKEFETDLKTLKEEMAEAGL